MNAKPNDAPQDSLESMALLCSVISDNSEDPEEKDALLTKTREVLDAFNQLCQVDVPEFFSHIEKELGRVVSVEELQNELTELLDDLDERMHDLYVWFNLRPVLSSVSACDKV